MRITGSIIMRRYLKNLEFNAGAKNESENKIASTNKFIRASQSPLEAAKAFKVRKALAEHKTFEDNLKTADGIYTAAESSLNQVCDLIKSVYESLIYGANGTTNVDDDKQVIALTVEENAQEMVSLLNLVVSDRKIFGGVNNTTPAYRIEDGYVYYNGERVNLYQDPSLFKNSSVSYIDIGLGMKFLDDGTIDPQTGFPITFNGAEIMGCGYDTTVFNLNLDEANPPAVPNGIVQGSTYTLNVTLGSLRKTITFTADTAANTPNADDRKDNNIQAINDALQQAFSSTVLSVLPDGTLSVDGDMTKEKATIVNAPGAANQVEISESYSGFPNNIIQLTLDAAKCLRSGDDDQTAVYADMIYACMSSLTLALAKLGSNSKFIEFNQERVTNIVFNLSDQQNTLEKTPLEEESTQWKMLEMIYNATLQMSVASIPNSIFNFMR